jgi:hypothetical protein
VKGKVYFLSKNIRNFPTLDLLPLPFIPSRVGEGRFFVENVRNEFSDSNM